jgi:hypothetical protein
MLKIANFGRFYPKAKMPVCKRTPLEGELDCANQDFDVPDILLNVCETGRTGLLTFSTTEAERTLFVREGSYIFAKSSSMDDRLGEFLLRSQRVALRDLVSLSKMVKPGKRLGALLVESGALDPKELVQSVVGQVRSIVLGLFRWTKAQYRFVEQELPSKETITLSMPTSKLIVDGIQGIDSWWRIERGIGELDSLYRAVSGTEEAVRSVHLDTPALELLAMLSKPKRIGDACTDSSLTELEVCKLLWVFRSLGWVESVEDDGTALLDNWQMNAEGLPVESAVGPLVAEPEPVPKTEPPLPEAAPSQSPGLVAPELPAPGPAHPILSAANHGDGPHFESDKGLPFTQESSPRFPPADSMDAADAADEDQTVYLPPAARAPNSVEVPEGVGEQKTEQDPDAVPALDPSMDMDMEGLSEALKSDSSK